MKRFFATCVLALVTGALVYAPPVYTALQYQPIPNGMAPTINNAYSLGITGPNDSPLMWATVATVSQVIGATNPATVDYGETVISYTDKAVAAPGLGKVKLRLESTSTSCILRAYFGTSTTPVAVATATTPC